MAEALSPATIAEVSKALFALGVPAKAEYHLGRDGFGPVSKFALTTVQKTALIRRAKDHWVQSFTAQAKLLDDSACKKLHTWLQTKRETFERALGNKSVLHFDVLVLGIVSTAVAVYVLFFQWTQKPFSSATQLAINPTTLIKNLVT